MVPSEKGRLALFMCVLQKPAYQVVHDYIHDDFLNAMADIQTIFWKQYTYYCDSIDKYIYATIRYLFGSNKMDTSK